MGKHLFPEVGAKRPDQIFHRPLCLDGWWYDQTDCTHPSVRFQERITTDVLEKVGTDQRINWGRLRTIDSLIIASGLVNEVERIVSNDTHFRSPIPGGLLLSFARKG